MSKSAFLFPGQGAQTVGMAQQLCESLPAARNLFDRANALLGYDLAQLCAEGPSEKLDSTVYSQPALFVASLAALELLRQDSPDAVESVSATAGLSLGEYTSLVFAEVMSFEDGLGVVQTRGQAMQDAADAASSGMVSLLGLEMDAIEQLCNEVRGEEVMQVANILCPGQIVVSGHSGACERIAAAAIAQGAMKAIPLSVAGAFHTSLMQPAVARLTAALGDVPMSSPRIPVVSNVDARPHNDPEEIRDLLIQQVISPVRWEDSMRYLLGEGVEEIYDIGPGRVLCGLMRRIHRKTSCHNNTA